MNVVNKKLEILNKKKFLEEQEFWVFNVAINYVYCGFMLRRTATLKYMNNF